MRNSYIALSLTLLMSVSASGAVFAKNEPVEILKYFNPIQEKSYLNKSQDRLIKKKAFKVNDLPTISPVANKELGYFAVIKDNDNITAIKELLSKPYINGVSVTYTWNELEPVEDTFKWESLDRILELCAQTNRTAIVRVATSGIDKTTDANDTPKWVFDGGAKAITYKGADGQNHQMSLFWDKTYLANWDNFLSEFGARYDKNPNIHSIGITGGGLMTGNLVTPSSLPAYTGKTVVSEVKTAGNQLDEAMKKEHGMTQRLLDQHGKYIVDLFAKSFPTARLNFDLGPQVDSRMGQDVLDEISDYAIRRYGQRIFLTRLNADAKHGFDDYRLFLKFRPDTLTGIQISENVTGADLEKISRYALDDGISYAEIPASILLSTDPAIQKPLSSLASHIGYQLLVQQATVPTEAASGEPIKATFKAMNFGAATAKRPSRQLDKDIAASFRVEIELKDAEGKSAVLSYHTPETPTNTWAAGHPVAWEEELRMPQLAPGEYSVWMSVVDSETKRKISFIDIMNNQEPKAAVSAPIGKIKILPPSSRSIGASETINK